MSASFYAVACLGVKIDRDRLYRRVRVRGCSHPAGEGRFCPLCGSPTYNEAKEPVAGYLPGGSRESGWEPRLGGLPVREWADGGVALVGAMLTASAGGRDLLGMPAPPDLAALEAEIREALAPLGAWDGSAFGLWCLAEISC